MSDAPRPAAGDADEMAPGFDLDRAVAAAVFGRHWPAPEEGGEYREESGHWHCVGYQYGRRDHMPFINDRLPRYSTDIAAAWLVVERMRGRPDGWQHNLHLVSYTYGRTYAHFGLERESDDYAEGNGKHATSLAICRAALKAVSR